MSKNEDHYTGDLAVLCSCFGVILACKLCEMKKSHKFLLILINTERDHHYLWSMFYSVILNLLLNYKFGEQSMKLFVFDHCPYCVRAMLATGLKSLPIEISYILEDDTETPTKMIGKPMVPILEYEAGKYMPESLDIVQYLDSNYGAPLFTAEQNPKILEWITANHRKVNECVMARYAKMDFPEFATDSARQMFVSRHEENFGSFDELFNNSAEYKANIEAELKVLANEIDLERVLLGKYSMDDIILFPLLRALTCVKDLSVPKNVQEYTELLADKGNLPLFYNQAC